MNKPKILLKIVNGSKVVKRVATKKTKRIYHILKLGDFKDCQFNVCVTYGKGITNRGIYKTQGEMFNALKAFLEIKDY